MPRTFEELAGEELDALYQGALFLAGGEARGAERLLVDAVTLAFEEHAADTDPPSVERWLETRLVRSFLKHVTGHHSDLPPETARRLLLDPETFDDLGSEALFAAAQTVPPLPRAALWLVLLRRWSYADAAHALGVEPDELPELLAFRDVLVAQLMRAKGTRSRHDVRESR